MRLPAWVVRYRLGDFAPITPANGLALRARRRIPPAGNPLRWKLGVTNHVWTVEEIVGLMDAQRIRDWTEQGRLEKSIQAINERFQPAVSDDAFRATPAHLPALTPSRRRLPLRD